MKDLRLEKLANTIINYSLKAEKGEIVYIYTPLRYGNNGRVLDQHFIHR